ncbi:MAG: MFS transporter [Vicinamibacterales bacterium]
MKTEAAGWRVGRVSFPPLVWIVLGGTLLTRTAFFMVWPFMAVILARDFSLRPSRIGSILGSAFIASALLGFYSGNLSDRFGRRPVMMAGCAGAVMAYATLALAHTVAAYGAGALLAGVSMTILELPGKAVIADYIDDPRKRELAFHARYFLINVGAAIGPLAGILFGLSARQTTFWMTVAAYGLFAVVIMVAFRWTPEHAHRHDRRHVSLRAVVALLRVDHQFLLLLLAMLLVMTAYAQQGTTLIQYIAVKGGSLAVRLVTALLMTNAITIVLFQFPLLHALRAYELNVRTFIGLALFAVAFVWYALIPVNGLVTWIAATWVLSVGEAILFPTLQLQVDRLAPDGLKGSYFGAAGLAGLGFGLGPLAGGFLLEFIGGPATFVVMAATVGVAALCCGFASRHATAVSVAPLMADEAARGEASGATES